MFIIQRRTTEKMVARFTELQRTLPNATRAQATIRNSTSDRDCDIRIPGTGYSCNGGIFDAYSRRTVHWGIRWRCHMYSVLCFFASVICLVVSTQPTLCGLYLQSFSRLSSYIWECWGSDFQVSLTFKDVLFIANNTREVQTVYCNVFTAAHS
ncbi:hypothetical protein B0H14DRAFT_171540 [Mycena olivaceomarginata]|nr:hypothetical protein B0H14DRAFT_171540 [Mycena olivaceomarginata]